MLLVVRAGAGSGERGAWIVGADVEGAVGGDAACFQGGSQEGAVSGQAADRG